MDFRGLGLCARLVVLSGAIAAAAHAEPTASEKETARTMMDEGHARRDAGDHRGARAQLQGADALMRVPTTAIEVGREQIALGQLVEARDTLGRVARTPPTAGEPDAFRLARKAAETLDQQLSGRIPALQISETGAPLNAPVSVMVDGAEIPLAALIAPFKVDPGHHVVVARSSGTEARQEVDLPEGQTVAVALVLARTAAGPTNGAPDAPSTPPVRPVSAEASDSPAAGWMRWGGFALAGVGAIVGGITGAMSLSSASSANKGCVNDRCPPATWGSIDSARTTGAVSTASFIVAGVGVALGVTSFVIGGHSSKASVATPTGIRLTASLGPGNAFVEGTF